MIQQTVASWIIIVTVGMVTMSVISIMSIKSSALANLLCSDYLTNIMIIKLPLTYR